MNRETRIGRRQLVARNQEREPDMDVGNRTTPTGRRQFLAKSGAVAVSGTAFFAAFAAMAGAQDAASATPEGSRSATPAPEGAGSDRASRNLELMDRLDFQGWNAEDWTIFSEIHGEDVLVEGFGQATTGLPDHLAWARPFREANPGFFIESHPIRIGVGDWTAVTGLFTNGGTMATIARWENDRIAEEYLFLLDVG